jgi:hypothetical protein
VGRAGGPRTAGRRPAGEVGPVGGVGAPGVRGLGGRGEADSGGDLVRGERVVEDGEGGGRPGLGWGEGGRIGERVGGHATSLPRPADSAR